MSPGQNVLTLARPDLKEAVVDIGTDFPVALGIGLPFTVSLELLPNLHVEGRIREIAPGVTLDEVHATVGCKLTVPEILPAMRLVG